MEDIDGGLHPAVDGQSLDEDEDDSIKKMIHGGIEPRSSALEANTLHTPTRWYRRGRNTTDPCALPKLPHTAAAAFILTTGITVWTKHMLFRTRISHSTNHEESWAVHKPCGTTAVVGLNSERIIWLLMYSSCLQIASAVCYTEISILATHSIIIIIIAFKGDFLQSPQCAANRLLHVRSNDPGTTVCKSRATHRALITCNMSCYVPRDTKRQLSY